MLLMGLSYIAAVYAPEYGSGFIAKKADPLLARQPDASCRQLLEFLVEKNGLENSERGLAEYVRGVMSGNFALGLRPEDGSPSRELSPLERAAGLFRKRHLRGQEGTVPYMAANIEIRAVAGSRPEPGSAPSEQSPGGEHNRRQGKSPASSSSTGSRSSFLYSALLPAMEMYTRVSSSAFLQAAQRFGASPSEVEEVYARADKLTTPWLLNLSGVSKLVCSGQKEFYLPSSERESLVDRLKKLPQEDAFFELAGRVAAFAEGMLKAGYMVGGCAASGEGLSARSLDASISVFVRYLHGNASEEESGQLRAVPEALYKAEGAESVRLAAILSAAPFLKAFYSRVTREHGFSSRTLTHIMNSLALGWCVEQFERAGRAPFALGYAAAVSGNTS
ncbi:MAG: hypothetical protein HY518_00280 [Candidatus Aenigmarchaeota archaeon]|nr:hypothetical protein [Candidatus Aenigmarchaeota archaeon]